MSARALARVALAVGVVGALGACGGKAGAGRGTGTGGAGGAAATEAFVEIARLEGERTGGERLLALAKAGDPVVRQRAIRALARTGRPEDVPALVGWLDDAAVRTAAAEGLGLVGEGVVTDARVKTSVNTRLIAALGVSGDEAWQVAVARALGRMGDGVTAGPALAAHLPGATDRAQEALALALGTLGHRKQAIAADAFAALVAASGDPAPDVRYAVAYALFRAPGELPPAARATLETLATKDAEPETRAIATRGLAAHGLVDAAAVGIDDDDWRVRVQAVRALGGEGSTTTHHERLAVWLGDELTRMRAAPRRWDSPAAHVMLEALDQVRAHADERDVAQHLFGIVNELSADRRKFASGRGPGLLAVSTAECWATAAAARAALVFSPGVGVAKRRAESVAACGGDAAEGSYPVHERQRLITAILGDKAVPADEALAVLAPMAGDADARVRAAVAEAAVAHLPAGGAAKLVAAAFADRSPLVVGTAAAALGERLGKDGAAPATPADAALLDAAARRLGDAEPEIALDLVTALCAQPDARFLPALRLAHTDPAAVVRAAARTCLEKLEGKDPGEGVARAAAPAPTADVADMVRTENVAFHVVTTAGAFDIYLLPDVAPWNVATFAALAQSGLFDNTPWHRVVPDFVVQGGDPTGSGWGGPGYTVPAETSTRPYRRGTIGIADSGKDTGGSQWFVMHSRAPHLEQRYTVIGGVLSGMEIVDRLHVGDRILKVTRVGQGGGGAK